jgi:hypothetical protein
MKIVKMMSSVHKVGLKLAAVHEIIFNFNHNMALSKACLCVQY